jgi:phosphoglycerate kinase
LRNNFVKNDAEFAKKLASYGNVYINDAFGVCHRSHASVDAITKFFPKKSCCGDLVQLELKCDLYLLLVPLK